MMSFALEASVAGFEMPIRVSGAYLQVLDKELKMAKFEVYKDSQGEFRWRLRAANGEVIASGEGYTSKEGCLNGIESVKKNAPSAEIEDQTK
jgi:uncharacterized protein YegP (UPF0339 family)